MDPLIIHHVIRHPLSRIETNNFQDKSGCSINGIRSFLFEEGIVRDLDGMGSLVNYYVLTQDYRGYPIHLAIDDFDNFPLSDEILRMKNVQFYFLDQSKPIHKLVFLEPHFVEEERNLIENLFSYLEPYNYDNYEEWDCFQMDNEGHLVSLKSQNFQLSNESIEHLSNFSQLRNLALNVEYEGNLTNISLLSDLKNLSVCLEGNFQDQELFQDLGLFSNLLSLSLVDSYYSSKTKFLTPFTIAKIKNFLVESCIIPPSFSNLSNLANLFLSRVTFGGFF